MTREPRRFGVRLTATALIDVAHVDLTVHFTPKTAPIFASIIGDGSVTRLTGVAHDATGNVIVSGAFTGSLTLGNVTMTGAAQDGFVAKLSTTGAVLWAKAISGAGIDSVEAVDVDNEGNVAVLGQIGSMAAKLDETNLEASTATLTTSWPVVASLTGSGVVRWAKVLDPLAATSSPKLLAGALTRAPTARSSLAAAWLAS